MDFELSEQHRLIRDTAHRIAREKVAPRSAALDETGEYPEDIFRIFADAGLFGLTIPEQYGGSGAGVLALALAVEEVSKYDNACGLMILLSALPTQPVVIGGTEEQKQRWLPSIARGETRAAFCLTEPNHGSDAANLEARAARDGDDWSITGEKMYISGGSVANWVSFFARTGGPGAKGISAFILPADTPGFRVARCDRKMGVRGVPTANIVVEHARVPADHLIGGRDGEGRGFNIAMLTLNTLRPVVGARGLGLAEGCVAYALDFARGRETFGQPLTDHQAIQFMFADAAMSIEAARLLVYRGAWLVDQGKYTREHAPYLSIAKAFATEMANKVASDMLQVLGAQGYMMDHPIERQYRDARQLMIVEGTSQIQRLVIARAMLERELNYPF